jgi:O-methyltransferase involved in polyketide biosynthesis
LLGAGFDSFCLRRPTFAEHVEIYEIDHPATQALKVERIRACGASPASVHFVPADLSHMSVGAALAASPFDSRRLAFFSWLGVTDSPPRASRS